jgi:hypothetical protein
MIRVADIRNTEKIFDDKKTHLGMNMAHFGMNMPHRGINKTHFGMNMTHFGKSDLPASAAPPHFADPNGLPACA